jgi:sigma-E factor negative regulatory protein RseC
MTQIATVEKILEPGLAEIAVPRQSACAHECSECAGCGSTGAVVHARAQNPVGAQPGQKVVVESSTKKLLGIAGLVYLVPLALFLLGYGIGAVSGWSGGMRYLPAACGFAAGVVLALFYDRRVRKQGGVTFTIVRLF